MSLPHFVDWAWRAGRFARGAFLLAGAVVLAAAPTAALATDEAVDLLRTAAEPSADRSAVDEPDYKTPRAGEAFRAEVLGEVIEIPANDRRTSLGLSLGGLFFSPEIGDQPASFFGGVTYRNSWDEDRRWLKMTLAGAYNEVEYAEGGWNESGIDLLGRFWNLTSPLPHVEAEGQNAIEVSRLYWGSLLAGTGLGLRFHVPPYHSDNDFRIQAIYELGYAFTHPDRDTLDTYELPPDTLFHQVHVRFLLDCLERNLIELAHEGVALGADLYLTRRDRWADHGISPEATFRAEDTRDHLKLFAFFRAAMGLPFLSERHRLLFYAGAGWAPNGNLDRFSAFRGGGGPPSSDYPDLSRLPYPGALVDEMLIERYLILTVEYRLEVIFFLYLHLRGTIAWARAGDLRSDLTFDFNNVETQAAHVGFTSGFFFGSRLQVEYVYRTAGPRAEAPGHAVVLNWEIAF